MSVVDTKFQRVSFYWNCGNTELHLTGVTLDYAQYQAKRWGWKQSCWYNPKTWGNKMYANEFSTFRG